MTRKSEPTHTQGMTWLGKVRLRALVAVIGVPIALVATISALPVWVMVPIVVAAVTVTVSRLTSGMQKQTCWTCGEDLSAQGHGVHGLACPHCGTLNMFGPMGDPGDLLAESDDEDDDAGDRSKIV
ncbi:MAG: hypothetical protein H6812_04980 [Phycisphaeraceae bacterium]|nr:hypothetical protein [Phycisphaerales bacterium]MCA9305913.1 hypothetical protein [Phycisphaerales bacterium]MCB9842593.1 hypothetical protein [Phycisphaeraceae bacterium]